MCETCHVPGSNASSAPRATRITQIVLVLVTIGTLAAVALSQESQPAPNPRAPSVPDRVFLDDMARQLADARRIAAQAADSPLFEDLVRRIERDDRQIAGDAPGAPARGRQRPGPVNDRAVRNAIRRHITADRIIARVALETAAGAETRREAAALLRASRAWTLPPRI